MSKRVKTSYICQTLGEVQLEWQMPDFYRSRNTIFQSPDFCFSDSWWCLMMYPNDNKEHSDSVEVYLERKDSGPPKTVELSLGIKTTDGTKDRGTAIYKVPDETGKVNVMGPFRLISKLNLMQQRAHMVPSDVLTIACTLSTVDPHFPEVSLCNRVWSLSQSLRKLLTDDTDTDDTDFTVKLKDGDISAHQAILKARCGYFAKIPYLEEHENEAECRDIEEDIFECVLTYLYTGEVEGISNKNASKIYIAAKKFQLAELHKFCVHYMNENLSNESICEAIEIAEKYKELELERHAMDYLTQHADQIFELDGWKKFKAENEVMVSKLLEKIIKGMKLAKM